MCSTRKGLSVLAQLVWLIILLLLIIIISRGVMLCTLPQRMGSWRVHAVRDPAAGVHPASDRYRVHHRGTVHHAGRAVTACSLTVCVCPDGGWCMQ